jgi:outer membrane receptor protein involved in Fe transport
VRTNVAQVDIAGIELELRASPWDGGFVSVDLGYLDNEYGEFVYPDPDDPANVIDETNTSIADLTAKWTINVGIEHEFALANGATLTPRLNVYAQDDYDYQSSTLDAPIRRSVPG